MCGVSTEVTTLKDPPCIWQTSLCGIPKTGSERAGLWLTTQMAKLPSSTESSPGCYLNLNLPHIAANFQV